MSPEIQNHLVQLKWLLMLLIAVVCPLLALMLGGTTVSLASLALTRRSGCKQTPGWVTALLKRATPSLQRDTLVVLTIIASLLLFKIIYRPRLFSNPSWLALAWVFTTGLGLMIACRYRLTGRGVLDRAALTEGALGVVLVTLSCLLLACTESLLLTPEYWPVLGRVPYLFFSWHGLVRFVEFALLAGAITGNALLFSSVPSPSHAAADRTARNVGNGLALGSLLLWPPVLCLEVALLPEMAASPALFFAALLSVVLAGTAACLVVPLPNRPPTSGRLFLALVLLLFWSWAFMGHAAREEALTPAALAGLAPPRVAAVRPAPAAPAAPAAPTRADAGERLFARQCTVCHRFDQRLVGPPLNTVVPAYRENPEQLTAFLRNPVKRNPAYPAMPNLGLTTEQAQDLAAYLFRQVPR